MATFRIAEDDIWVFSAALEKVVELIADPRRFVRSQKNLENVLFEGPGQPLSPISIQFIYSLEDTSRIYVQGVDRTSLITVRMPQIEHLALHFDNAKQIKEYVEALRGSIPDPAKEVKRLQSPAIGYAHFNPTAAGEKSFRNIAQFISNPELIPAFLNAIADDNDPQVILPDGTGSPDKKRTRFELVQPRQRFRYHLVSAISGVAIGAGGGDGEETPVEPCADGMVLRQCSKPSGTYGEQGTEIVLGIEDVQQTLWCDDVIDPA
ncbi:MAG: hypothetical protein OHK0029_15700 [Armatimonadaceae bacterium]